MGKAEFDQVIMMLPMLTTKERNNIARLLNQNTPVQQEEFTANEKAFHEAFSQSSLSNRIPNAALPTSTLQSTKYDQWRRFCGTSSHYIRKHSPKASAVEINLIYTYLCMAGLSSMKDRNIPLTLTSFMQAHSRDIIGEAEWDSIICQLVPRIRYQNDNGLYIEPEVLFIEPSYHGVHY